MKQPNNLGISFSVSLGIHVLAGLWAAHVAAPGPSAVVPEFRAGKSAIKLTLLPAQEEAAVQAEPEPERLPVEPAPETDPRKEGRSGNEDASLEDKGVKAAHVAETRIRPRYPLGSRLRGEEGVVTVRVNVNERGYVDGAEVLESSGHPALDRAALSAVGKTHFVAEDGAPAYGGEVVLSFRFRLTD